MFSFSLIITDVFTYVFTKESTICLLSDVNECVTGSDRCHDNATCSNSDGSYLCTCGCGYIGNGTICEGKLLTKISCLMKYSVTLYLLFLVNDCTSFYQEIDNMLTFRCK